MNVEIIKDNIQNKNFMMLFASAVFMCGILGCFYNSAIISGAIITTILTILLYLRIFDIKKIILFLKHKTMTVLFNILLPKLNLQAE